MPSNENGWYEMAEEVNNLKERLIKEPLVRWSRGY